MFDDKDYFNAKPADISQGLRDIIIKLNKHYYNNDYEKNHKELKLIKDKSKILYIGKSVSFLDKIRDTVGSRLNNLNLEKFTDSDYKNIIELLNKKSDEAENLIKKMKEQDADGDTQAIAQNLISDLALVVKFRDIAEGVKNLQEDTKSLPLPKISTNNATASSDIYKCKIFTFNRRDGSGSCRGKNFKLELGSEKYKLLCNFTTHPDTLFTYGKLWEVLGEKNHQTTYNKDMNDKIRDLKTVMKLNKKDGKIFFCNRGYTLKCK